jgi:two-component system, NtrC family, nitrogen regulation sensor histidine kinase NtrY
MTSRRFNLLLGLLFVAVLLAIPLEFRYVTGGPLVTRLMLLLLLNFTLFATLVLIFFVGKSLVKLYIERRDKVPGHKFKTKLVVTLVVLTMIPAVALFAISGSLISTYIDRWFAPQVKEPLENAIEMAKSFYDIRKEETLNYARSVPDEGDPLPGFTVRRLSRIPADVTETVRAAFDGREGTEVISRPEKDIVRAVVPDIYEGVQEGVIVVESSVPESISRNVDRIRISYEDYLTLESWQIPIRLNYLMILGFVTLLVAFMALWVALRISKGITDPIQSLAQATEMAAAGNLNISVPVHDRKDEIGLLTDSFNNMILELKEKEESLQYAYMESDRRRLFMENILDNINSGVITLDKDGRILMINRRGASVLDVRPEQILNRHYHKLIALMHSEDLKNLVESIEGREFKPVKKELHVTVAQRKRILWVFITSLKSEQDYVGLLVVFDDLTEVIEAQKALTWQDVARKIAHEIKNPLTPIRLSTERMIKKWEHRDTDFDDIFRRCTRTIVKEVDGLKKLVDEFARFGRMPEMQRKPTSLEPLFAEVVDLFSDFRGVDIEVKFTENMPDAEIDREQFKRVLVNIFDNAIQALQNEGKLAVHITCNPYGMCRIEIADDGPGIADEDKEKLFLPYFSTKKDGAGLGLAIAGRIVKEHGGSITVRDNEPRGTVFSIEIPLKES